MSPEDTATAVVRELFLYWAEGWSPVAWYWKFICWRRGYYKNK